VVGGWATDGGGGLHRPGERTSRADCVDANVVRTSLTDSPIPIPIRFRLTSPDVADRQPNPSTLTVPAEADGG